MATKAELIFHANLEATMASTATVDRPQGRIRYAFGQVPQPVLQPVASFALDRTTPTNRQNTRLIRDLIGVDPDTLTDEQWDDVRGMLARLALDWPSIELRAGAMMLPQGTPLNENQLFESGLDADTTALRHEWLDRVNRPDPAIALRDRLTAEERSHRATGSITNSLPTDILVAMPEPTRTTAMPATARTPMQIVQDVPAFEAISATPLPEGAEDRWQDQEPAEITSTDAPDTDLSEADQRCLAALVMLREGASRKAIAERFGKDPSTVWRWLRRAEALQRDKLNAVRPADVLADFEATFQAKRADLEEQYTRARDAGFVRQVIALSREIRRWHVTRFDVLHRSGTFRSYMHPAVVASSVEAERQGQGMTAAILS